MENKGSPATKIIIVLVVLAAIFCLAAFKAVASFIAYEEGDREYAEVTEKYVKVKEIPAESPEPEEEEEEEESPWTEDQSIPNLDIDYDALKAENPDYFCWLYVEATGISYPVTQGEDNEFYLHHTFDKTQNVNGCVYLDYRAWQDLKDYNSFIFGHNMRNGSMFGSLKRILNDPETALEKPYFYLIERDQVRKYHIYAIHVAAPVSDTFHISETEKEYGEYIEMVKADSVCDMGEDVTTEDKTITLSTCSGTGAGKKRLVLHGKLVGIIKTDGSETVSWNSVRALGNDF